MMKRASYLGYIIQLLLTGANLGKKQKILALIFAINVKIMIKI